MFSSIYDDKIKIIKSIDLSKNTEDIKFHYDAQHNSISVIINDKTRYETPWTGKDLTILIDKKDN